MAFGSSLRVLIGGGIKAIPLADNFDRANTTTTDGLGKTSTGQRDWTYPSGAWQISSNRAYTGTDRGLHPIARVESYASDVDVQTNISGGGGDCLYVRVTDVNNWIRLRQRGWQTSTTTSTSCCTKTCNNTLYSRDCSDPGGCNSCNCCVPMPDSCDGCPTTCCGCLGCCTDWGCKTYTGTNSCGTHCCETGTCTSTTYQDNYAVYLEKRVGGTITTITSWGGSYSLLRMRLTGTSVQVFTGTTDRGSFAVAEHATVSYHGIGRGPSEYNGHALDNFSLTPL